MKKFLSSALIAIVMFAQVPQKASANNFSDVFDTHIYAKEIQFLKDELIVNGYPDGSYMPEGTVTRAEFIKIILESAMGTGYASKIRNNCQESYFTDITYNQWFFSYVCFAKRNKMIDGYSDGTFRPNNNITFAEAAKIIGNAFIGYSKDINQPEWWTQHTDSLFREDAIPPTISINQYGTHLLTRGEMAFIMYQLLNKIFLY